MTSVTTKAAGLQLETETGSALFDNWFDPIEHGIRPQVCGFIEELIRCELDEVLARPRYGRREQSAQGADSTAGVAGHRHGSRTGTFGKVGIAVPRARLWADNGATTEWRSKALRAYQRCTLAADAVIAGAYLAGTNTRRVRRALGSLFGGTVGKDTVSRVWRKVKSDWEARNARPLAAEPIVRLILDGTAVRVRLDRKATSISLLVVIGVRADWQKVLLSVRSLGGESEEAWRAVLDDLIVAQAAVFDRRWWQRAGSCAHRGVVRSANAALHHAQAPQSAGARARAAARGGDRRLHRHDLRGDAG
jgi:transposase-like protein